MGDIFKNEEDITRVQILTRQLAVKAVNYIEFITNRQFKRREYSAHIENLDSVNTEIVDNFLTELSRFIHEKLVLKGIRIESKELKRILSSWLDPMQKNSEEISPPAILPFKGSKSKLSRTKTKSPKNRR